MMTVRLMKHLFYFVFVASRFSTRAFVLPRTTLFYGNKFSSLVNENCIVSTSLKFSKKDDDTLDKKKTTFNGNMDDHSQMLESLGLQDPRNNDALLEYSIDSFLRGEYDKPYADDASAPLPGLTPQNTIEQALRSLRKLDEPEPSHGAACFLRFCVPLSRAERWGGSGNSLSSSSWKELLRGALTPTMLARRLRASEEFSTLLDWSKLDVTEGAYAGKKDWLKEDGLESVAFVHAALYFNEDNSTPEILQFKLLRMNGVWLIDSAQRCHSSNDLFQKSNRQKQPLDQDDGKEGDLSRPKKKKR